MEPKVIIENISVSDSSFSKRFGHVVVRVGPGEYLLHGGACFAEKEQSLSIYSDLWSITTPDEVYFTVNKVKEEGTKPQPRYSHHAVKWGSKIVVFGGANTYLASHSAPGMHLLDTDGWRWSVLQYEGQAPNQLSNSANLVGDLVFVFGGMLYGKVTNTMSVFHIRDRRWIDISTIGAAPVPRCDHAAGVVKQYIYYFGGCCGKEQYLNDLHRFDTGALRWESIDTRGSIPVVPRAGLQLVPHHTKDLYLVGGYNDRLYPDGGPVVEDLLKFSLPQRKWKVVNTQLQEDQLRARALLCRYHTAAFIDNSRLILVGGITVDGESSDVLSFKILNPSERIEAAEIGRGIFTGQKLTSANTGLTGGSESSLLLEMGDDRDEPRDDPQVGVFSTQIEDLHVSHRRSSNSSSSVLSPESPRSPRSPVRNPQHQQQYPQQYQQQQRGMYGNSVSSSSPSSPQSRRQSDSSDFEYEGQPARNNNALRPQQSNNNIDLPSPPHQPNRPSSPNWSLQVAGAMPPRDRMVTIQSLMPPSAHQQTTGASTRNSPPDQRQSQQPTRTPQGSASRPLADMETESVEDNTAM